MSSFDSLVLEDFKKGIKGENIGIPIPLKRVSRVVNNIQQRFYTLVGAQSGVGKSALVTMLYVLFPYMWYVSEERREKFKVIYFSMERDKKYQIQKMLCVWLYLKYGKLIDVPTLNSWEGGLCKIDTELETMILSGRKFIESLVDSGVVNIIAGQDNPTGIWKFLIKYANENGKSIEKDVKIDGEVKYKETTYTPNDPNLYTVVIIDHIGRIKLERGFSKKQNADKLSEYLSISRDRYGFSPVVVSQFNRGQGDSLRRFKASIEPMPEDFKDSGNMYEDCDIAMALYNPYKFKGIDDCLGYDPGNFMSPLGFNRFRALYVLKNSYGRDDVGIGLNFIGECGVFSELPPPDKMPTVYDSFSNGSFTRNQILERMKEKNIKLT